MEIPRGNLIMRTRENLDYLVDKLVVDRLVREGMITTGGLRLLKPDYCSIPEVKFSFLSDKRFFDSRYYKEFESFMPNGFSIVGEPKDESAFVYVLRETGLARNGMRNIHSANFLDIIGKGGFKSVNSLSPVKEDIVLYSPVKDDIILYSPFEADFTGYNHAGIYNGDDKVRSRWGFGSPVIEHPLKDYIGNIIKVGCGEHEEFMNGQTIFYRKSKAA
ncbi:hypothetical protein AUJ62_03690 [Candidatus Pacearchaeota archaeon CG1_02_32_21]|nr:MAG: hypothetical protein AUJ62_03690 [Candidatus Pacearchaeota archaeon CG1_02_32_21]